MNHKAEHGLRYCSTRMSLRQWLWLLIAAVVVCPATGLLAQAPEAKQSQAAASTPMPCTPAHGGPETAEQQICLSEHIPGFGGYDFAGPCEVIVYLTDPQEEPAARALLERYIKVNSPDCVDQMSFDIRKGEYEFVDLHRLGNQASELLVQNEKTSISGAEDVIGPFIIDNRVTFFIDPESLTDSKETIAMAKQVLLARCFDLEAFHLTSNPFLTRSLSWKLLGISDPCIPVNPPLSICFSVQDVQASFVDATPTSVLGIAQLRSRPDLVYAFTVSWDISDSLEEHARTEMMDLPTGSTLSKPSAVCVDGFPALRYDLEPVWTVDSSRQPPISMVLFIDTGAGIASIAAMPKKPGVSSDDLYAGAESVARILRVQED